MPETTPLIKAALNLRGGAGFDVYNLSNYFALTLKIRQNNKPAMPCITELDGYFILIFLQKSGLYTINSLCIEFIIL